MIDIKDISGSTRFSTSINEGSKRKFLLMKEDYISLKFSLDKPVYFKLGDYVDDPRFGLLELCDLQKPTYNNSNGGYEYDLRLDAYYWKWKNKKFKFTPETGGQEASWNLTASLDIQLGVFLRNLQALGYTYKGTNFEFSIDSTVENKSLPMTYDNANLLDSLTRMAEAWGCEWWITESVIRFGRCEHSDPVNFELGKNVETMTRSDSQTNFATRVYAFGSTRNIPANYRPVDESIVVNGITQKRLMLPVGASYIDAYPNMSTEEAVEDVVVFEDVYPRRTGTVSDITIHEYTDIIKEEGKPDVVKKWNAYRFKDSGITFSNDYRLAGQELKIIFQSGALNGMEFVVIFNPCDKEGGETAIPEKNEDGSWNPLAQVWEIVRNEDYGRPLPGDSLIPKNGDTYILSGFDTKFVSDGMIPEAEQELKEKALKYIEKSKVDPSTYENKMMSDHMVNEDGTFKLFEAGDRVNLLNTAYFETGNRISRIIGFEYNLDIPYDSPVYTVGETASYSRLGEIESKVETLDYKGQTYTGNGGGGVYVIHRNDSTPASDSNVFSALRSMAEFISKTRPDVAKEVITFLKGVRLGNYTDKSGGIISVDSDGKTYAEVDRLKVRLKAYFETLEIQNVNSVGGKTIMTPAGSIKCIKVSDRDIITNNDGTTDETIWAYYRCYFLSDQEGVKVENRFKVGDLAYSQNFNIKTGTHEGLNNHYYWREVIAVGEDYIDLSKTKSDAGSDSPQAGDVICQLGNTSDKDRQNAIIISSVDLFSPSIILYQGIDNYSFLDKDFISYGVDATTKKAYFNVYGNMYVGDREKTTYFRYDQENGVEIKGRLVTRSGKDVEDNLSSMQDQLDGVKETFYGDYTPTLSNYPANEWVTDNVKQRHELDVFTNIQAYINDETTPDAGKSWRWITNNGAWEWTQISDSDTSKAFLEAAKAMQAAKEAQFSAIQANNAVIGLKDFTDTAFADGIISRSEAIAIESYINNILSIRNGVTESYNKIYSNPLLDGVDKVNLKSGFDGFILSTSELINTINAAVSDGTTTVVEKAAVDDKYDVFNTKYGDFTAYINAANKYIQDKINQSATNALDKVIELDYLKTALSGSTIVDGGLVLTSLVGTGYQHATDGFKLMSGISGIYDKSKRGGGAASWYGGAMKDLFDYPKGSAPSDVAKGLIRMDGTGYFAGGNLWWEEDGTLHADPLSFFVGENSIGFASALFKFIPKTGTIGDKWGDIDYVIPQKPFQKLTVASYIELGNGFKFKVDELNNSVCIEKENGDPVNFRVTGGITQYATGSSIASTIMDAIITDEVTITKAGGKLSVIGELGGGGISSLVVKLGSSIYNGIGTKDVVVSLPAYPTTLPASDVPAWAKAASKPSYVWNEISNKPSWMGDNKPSYAWSEIGSKPTTLGGYGITDAVTLATDQTINGVKTFGKTIAFTNAGVNVKGNGTWLKLSNNSDPRIQIGVENMFPATNSNIDLGGGAFRWRNIYSVLGNFSGQITSAVANGTAPISVASTSTCPNLNADLLDGYHAAGLYTISSYSGGRLTNIIGTTSRFVDLYNAHHNAGTQGGANGYLKVATITISGAYQNQPLTFKITQRGRKGADLTILFNNSGTAGATTLNSFFYTGELTAAYLINSTTGTVWDLYIQKEEAYGNIAISLQSKGSYMSGTSITWKDEFVSSVSGGATATYWNPASHLFTARSINGTNFDGTTNITTALWGTSRSFSIVSSNGSNASSAVSVNGSGNVSLYLPSTITASLSGNATTATALQTTRTLWGQSFRGDSNVSGSLTDVLQIKSQTGSWLDLYGGTTTGIAFYTGGTVKAVVANNGNFGIGTVSPSYKLHVDGIISANNRFQTTLPHSYAHNWPAFFNPANAMFGVNVVTRMNQGDSRSILTWKDDVNGQGFTTSYNIGTYRNAWKWGQMILAVSNADNASSYGAALNICGDGTVTIEGNLLVTGGITQYSNGVSTTDTFTSNILRANDCLLVGASTSKDAPERYICCYGKTGSSYICIGNSPSPGNTGEICYTHYGTGHLDNSISLGFYGGQQFGRLLLRARGNNFLDGSLTASGTITQGSDIRRKNIVRFTELTIDQVANAPLFDYYWKDMNDGAHTGTSAQYWQNVLPNTVRDNGTSGLALDYNGVNIAGLITVSREIVKLKRENEELRQEINQLKERAS